ncbi:MAG: DUF2961 domain-containing protein [Gemmatimonadaceae bacterium]
METPVGDCFGLNLGDYALFESQYIACSPGQSLNAYFAMPYRKSARLTIANEGTKEVYAFFSNIDYYEADAIPADAMYFHAQYRHAIPNQAQQLPGRKNPTGATNYVYCETHGRGHLRRYCLYRFHGDNPVTFTRYLKHTSEHEHANDRADNHYSCAYWYQDQPATDVPVLPPVAQRLPSSR